jgi:predicted nucleic-acid-binding protein
LKSVDTNVVVRLLLRDDAAQANQIDALVATGDPIVPATVIMETEWVLRAVYRYERADIADLLTALLVIDGVTVQDEAAVAWALDRYRHGADLADMLHVVTSGNVDSFVTFDKKMPRQAGADSPIPIEIPE